LKETRKENSKILEEIEQLRSEMTKLKEENVELHRKFRTLTNKYKELKRLSPEKERDGILFSKSLKEFDQDGRKREMDMEMLHNLQLNEKAQRIKRLEAQLEETKQSHLRDVERLQEQLERRKRQAAGIAWEEKSNSAHLGEPSEASKHIEELEDQIDELKKENQKLVKELSAFDLEFFEEIEDLKYKYSEAIREKQILEKMIQKS
jgi:chromosome segregation ATPase